MKYYACENHIELVMDIFVDETEAAPYLSISEEGQKCGECEDLAKFQLE